MKAFLFLTNILPYTQTKQIFTDQLKTLFIQIISIV